MTRHDSAAVAFASAALMRGNRVLANATDIVRGCAAGKGTRAWPVLRCGAAASLAVASFREWSAPLVADDLRADDLFIELWLSFDRLAVI